MPIWFKVVKDSLDVARVCRLRHKVFVEQEERFEEATPYVMDLYDAIYETINILAFNGDEPIGTIRAVMPNPVGLPALDHYDFGPYMSTLDGPCSCFGWLCVLQKYRRHPGLLFGLFKMAVRELRKNGMRHIVATLHPPLMRLLTRSFNAVRVGEDFESGELKVPMTPAYIDTDNFPPRTREIFHDPSKIIFNDSNVRRIYQEDEPLVTRGEIGDEAFLIMRGSVRSLPVDAEGNTIFPGPEDHHPLGDGDLLFPPGQIFGELALLDQGKRTTTIIPYSKEVDVMVWNKDEFMKQLTTDKDKALDICKLLGVRLRNQIVHADDVGASVTPILARVMYDASNEGNSDMDLVWLARQCGIWPDVLLERVSPWAEKGLVSHEKGRITVLDPGQICAIAEAGERLKGD